MRFIPVLSESVRSGSPLHRARLIEASSGRESFTIVPRAVLCALVFTLFNLSGSPAKAAGRPTFEVRKVREGPLLDGRLNDPCWKSSAVLADFKQVIPVEGARPSERTEVRAVFTDDALYIGARCFDSEPDKVAVKTLSRDSKFDSDDVFKVVLDTFNRGRDGYYFSVNPAGARSDAIFGSFSSFNMQWDTVWDAEALVDEEGWSVEIAIPFKSLSFDPSSGAWGANFERIVRRKQEVIRWTAISAAKRVTALEDLGELKGLKGLRQGLGLQLKPYGRSTYRESPQEREYDVNFKGGFDVTYRITPRLTALVTVYPDFAETDVDKRTVNLTRFPLFYPEKRDFFLQDSSLFSFGGLPSHATPYFSRRIGLGKDGKPIDIFGGLRLTGGRTGPT